MTSIGNIVKTLTGTTSLGQSRPGSNSNEGLAQKLVLQIHYN